MNTSSRPFALNLYSFLQDVLSDFFGGQRLVQNMRFLFEPSSSSDAQALITLSLQKICVINLGSNWRTRRVTHKTIITMIVSWELARDGNLIPFIFYFTGLLISKRWTAECSDWLMLPTFAKINFGKIPPTFFLPGFLPNLDRRSTAIFLPNFEILAKSRPLYLC